MSQTLYRKYRPQNFSQVIDQNHIKITLQNEIVTEQIAHAYLFTGPRGIGKTSLARIFAKALNCKNRKSKEYEPCGKCNACQNITNGKDLDLIEIDAATNTQVDKVRENIIENVRFTPHANKYKIFIIDEAHMLSTAAFNALLKTLEEPPEYAVFILCTTELHKLPETIISRCQRFDFSKISVEEIVKKLKKIVTSEKVKVADEVLKTIAFRSGGFIRDAESLLAQILTLLPESDKEITLKDIEPVLPRSDLEAISNLVQALINKNSKSGVEIINNLISEGIDIERFNLDLIDYLRKILLIKTNLKDRDYSIEGLPEKIQTEIIKQAEEIEFSELIDILENFIAKQSAIKQSEIQQLPLEIAIVEICDYQKQDTPIDTVKQEVKTTPQTTAKKNVKKSISKKKININLTDIKKQWNELLRASQQVNHSLAVILKAAYPSQLEGNQLELSFSFEIMAHKLKEEKCLAAVEKLFKQVFKNEILIKPVVVSDEEFKKFKPLNTNSKTKQSSENDEQLNNLLDSFGGKIVE